MLPSVATGVTKGLNCWLSFEVSSSTIGFL
jgi:hypothetical protein